MKTFLFVIVFLVFASAGYGQKYHPDEQAARDLIEKWNSGYRALDAETMAATAAPRASAIRE